MPLLLLAPLALLSVTGIGLQSHVANPFQSLKTSPWSRRRPLHTLQGTRQAGGKASPFALTFISRLSFLPASNRLNRGDNDSCPPRPPRRPSIPLRETLKISLHKRLRAPSELTVAQPEPRKHAVRTAHLERVEGTSRFVFSVVLDREGCFVILGDVSSRMAHETRARLGGA
ncbi:hypothetical protein C8F01DRAFT_1245333 [Mycena amicta]|nr:hypothetical protein C8F01DRAFT_1245333 [Mycena amicta]